MAIEGRVSYIEGRLDSLATKADVQSLRAELKGDLVRVVLGLGAFQLIALGALAAIMQLFMGQTVVVQPGP